MTETEPPRTIPEGLAKNKEELLEKLKPVTLEDLKKVFKKWLYLEDDEILDVVLACACDRKLPGDPVWLLLISPSGGTKTEIVRSLSGPGVYRLDTFTRHSLISGKIEKTHDGSFEPVKGILPQIRDKVLVIKDFTVILQQRREDRDDIFGQLRTLHDGYLDYGFGSMSEPVRIQASIGLIAACVPAVQMYQKLYTILGERFLTVRHRADGKKSAIQALANLGEETGMREELSSITERFLSGVEARKIKEPSGCRTIILNIADATAKLRTPVPMTLWRYEVQSCGMPTIEYPTRLSKQLLKLAQLLALIRGRDTITNADINTVKRVARDSCVGNRIKILEKVKIDENQNYTTKRISEDTEIPLTTCWRELKEMEYLGLCKYEKVEVAAGIYGQMKHMPERDGWIIKDSHLYDILGDATLDSLISGSSPPRELERKKEEVKEEVSEVSSLAGGDTCEKMENDRLVNQHFPAHSDLPPLEVPVPTPPGAAIVQENRNDRSSGDGHNTEKNFPCPECEAHGWTNQFSNERDLAAHMSTHHQSEEYVR